MKCFFKDLLQNFIKPEKISITVDYEDEANHLELSDMFFGMEFQEFVENKNIEVNLIKNLMVKYYITLCNEVKKRFDFSDEKLRLLKYFDPKMIQAGEMTTIAPLLKAFPFHTVSAEILNDEWRSLILYDKSKINEIFAADIVEGWTDLRKEKNLFEELLFKNLSVYMCSIAVLPHSSAAAERSFSILNDIKSAKRNTLKTETVSNQILVKEYCDGKNLFEPSTEMIHFYNSYKFKDGLFHKL